MKVVQKRYYKLRKKEKGKILDEICANLEIDRKSAIRLVNSDLSKKRKKRETLYTYSKKTIWIIEELWKRLDHPCGTIVKAAIPLWLPHLKKHYLIDAFTEDQLLSISSSTIDRRLKEKKKRYRLKLHSTTKPNYKLRSQIPIQTSSRHITIPGHCECDTVAHCGFSNSGQYIHTVNKVDIATSWVSRRAVLGKGSVHVKKALDHMRKELPFPLTHLDSDNGDEFINNHLISYCLEHHITQSRSRPYKKNDQAHIEQKNSTHVRRIFGRIRLDTPLVRDYMNDLYEHELMYYNNFFKPSQKLIKKKFVGAKTIRTFDAPQTPYQRVLKSKHVSQENKDALTALFNSLDPIAVKKSVDKKIARIFHAQYKSSQNETA